MQNLVSSIRSLLFIFVFIFIALRDAPSFLKGFTGYNSWLSFFPSTLSRSFHSLLAAIISDDLIEIILGSSVQFSCSVESDSLWPHELQHARPPCPSPPPGGYPNPCPLSQWWHPTISSSVVPFSSCPQSLPASGSFQMSQLFPSGGQSIGVSASASVHPMNIQNWFPLGLNSLISLLFKDLVSGKGNIFQGGLIWMS